VTKCEETRNVLQPLNSIDVPFQRLAPNRPRTADVLQRLQQLRPEKLLLPSTASETGIALLAGLFQWHDFLDESHGLAQSVEGAGPHRLGDHWHAIHHRREPDYGNAKYWLRAAGPSPIANQLADQADKVLRVSTARDAENWRDKLLADGRWNAFAFVDLCAACAADEESELALASRQIQRAEMLLLFEFICQEAH